MGGLLGIRDIHLHHSVELYDCKKGVGIVNKALTLISLAFAFALIGYLSMSSSSYKTVSALKDLKKPKVVTVIGNVTKGSVRVNELLEFKINDGRHEVKVKYNGFVRLDNVSGYGRVVVIGVYYPQNKTIIASRVEASCPSKEVLKAYK